MSGIYNNHNHFNHPNMHSHNHHNGRSRRTTRSSAAHHHQQHQKQMRALRLQKEAEESSARAEMAFAFRREFEAAKSFDFEDDDIFCPYNLLTDDDCSSLHSGSDRSSLSSGSPDHSPITQQIQPASTFLLPPSNFHQMQVDNSHQQKIHQPLAQRIGAKAIPIVDPSTRNVASPPPSVSPGRQMLQAQQFVSRRGW